jgi:hypothetical protein
VFAARIHVEMRGGAPLPDVADLHDLLRWQLEGVEVDNPLPDLDPADMLDPSSVAFRRIELTRLDETPIARSHYLPTDWKHHLAVLHHHPMPADATQQDAEAAHETLPDHNHLGQEAAAVAERIAAARAEGLARGVEQGRHELSATVRAELAIRVGRAQQEERTWRERARAAESDALEELAGFARAGQARTRAETLLEVMNLLAEHEQP